MIIYIEKKLYKFNFFASWYDYCYYLIQKILEIKIS